MSNGNGGNPVVRWVKESAAWRSLFRQPYPSTSRTRPGNIPARSR